MLWNIVWRVEPRINLRGLSEELRCRHVNLRVLNLGGENVDTGTPVGSMVFTVRAVLAQMELEIKRERINGSVTKRSLNIQSE